MIGMAAARESAMSGRPASSDGFRKVRRDHANETAEDYVEAIASIIGERGTCRVADLARLMRVSHVTVVKTVDRLVAAGLVEKAPYGPATLTPAGARMARTARMRHERVLAFLRSLGVPEAVARRERVQGPRDLVHHLPGVLSSPETALAPLIVAGHPAAAPLYLQQQVAAAAAPPPPASSSSGGGSKWQKWLAGSFRDESAPQGAK
jgi:DtxR family manganese transport transcriptional regulator